MIFRAGTSSAWLPAVEDGVGGMRFIDAVLASPREGSRWLAMGS